MARQCEACQCLLSENGMMGNGWRVTTGRKSGHIPPATDQSDERCQAESIHGQRSEKQVWHGQLSVWICREGTQRGLWKDLPGHKPNARGLHLQNVTDRQKQNPKQRILKASFLKNQKMRWRWTQACLVSLRWFSPDPLRISWLCCPVTLVYRMKPCHILPLCEVTGPSSTNLLLFNSHCFLLYQYRKYLHEKWKTQMSPAIWFYLFSVNSVEKTYMINVKVWYHQEGKVKSYLWWYYFWLFYHVITLIRHNIWISV